MKTVSDLRAKLERDEPMIGTWLQLPSPDAAEIMARAGYDFTAVDMEHGEFGRDGLSSMMRAIERGGSVPFVRLPEAGKTYIKTALEAGAQGLVFPMIESRAQLDEAIKFSLYPHFGGERGVGFCRANLYGKDFAGYVKGLAGDIFLVAQIEHVRAVENLEEILAHPRLDAIMVGPYDLSGSMGLTGQFDHPDFKTVMKKISSICVKMNARMGTHIVEPDPAALRAAVADGCRFIAYGIDALFLWRNAECPRV